MIDNELERTAEAERAPSRRRTRTGTRSSNGRSSRSQQSLAVVLDGEVADYPSSLSPSTDIVGSNGHITEHVRNPDGSSETRIENASLPAPEPEGVPDYPSPPQRSEENLPDLRRQSPKPVVPLERCVRTWLRDRTLPGRVEGENDRFINECRQHLTSGSYVLSTISPKGGSGKTTFSLTEGLVLASYPWARPIVVELNPDWGTVNEILGDANSRNLTDLLADLPAVERWGVGLLQGYVTMWGACPVITAPSHPDQMKRLSPRDYDRVLKLLSVHYNVVIFDCGTSFVNRLNQWAIQTANHIQVVGWPEQATMAKTVAAIDYLASERYARDYRGELADVNRAETRQRAMADMTLVLNGSGFAGAVDPVDPDNVRRVVPELNALIELPYSQPLRKMLGEGTLMIEAMPATYRRAVKKLLVAVLGRLADISKGE